MYHSSASLLTHLQQLTVAALVTLSGFYGVCSEHGAIGMHVASCFRNRCHLHLPVTVGFQLCCCALPCNPDSVH
jgi:hypothetical protein